MIKKICVLSLLFLSACGQKGDLYLPEQSEQQEKSHVAN